jgi:hypothetical protein
MYSPKVSLQTINIIVYMRLLQIWVLSKGMGHHPNYSYYFLIEFTHTCHNTISNARSHLNRDISIL